MRRRATPLLALALALCACGPRPQGDGTATQAAPIPPARVSAPTRALAEAASVAIADPVADRSYALPGEFAPDTGIRQLERRFGKDNVRIGEVPGAEGETARGVILFPDDPTRRAYLYFEDSQELAGLQLVRVVDEGSRWRLDNGIGIGTPLAKVVAMNGKPIRFFGFDWDYGGAITDWNGGKLAPAPDDPVIRQARLTHAEAPGGSYPSGEGEFASDDPRYPRLGGIAIVGEISASFPGEDDL
jgi:hypothetical protein